MSFTEDEINEFKVEATDLLDQAEKGLLALDKGEDFRMHYDAIFRAFHSIKGAAGMMEILPLQKHMHLLENTLTEQKSQPALAKEYVDLFLRGSDACRKMLDGASIPFDYGVALKSGATPRTASAPPAETKAPASPPPKAPESKPVEAKSPPPQSNFETLDSVSTITEFRPSPKPGSSGKVLVVDDEPEIVELLKLMLEESGFEVIALTEPEKVVDAVKLYNPNAVLSDISMPRISGLDLLADLNSLNPDLPVIFISGNVTKDLLIEAIGMGVFGVIEKPFHFGRVIETTSQAVARNVQSRLVNEGINLLMYQFSDLDHFLKTQGKEDVRLIISSEIKALVEKRRQFREMRKVRSESA